MVFDWRDVFEGIDNVLRVHGERCPAVKTIVDHVRDTLKRAEPEVTTEEHDGAPRQVIKFHMDISDLYDTVERSTSVWRWYLALNTKFVVNDDNSTVAVRMQHKAEVYRTVTLSVDIVVYE